MPADGQQINFEFSFSGGYISQDHVVVTVIDASGVESIVPFTWVGSSTIQVAPAPAAGKTVRIRRLTPNDAAQFDFTDGAVVTEANLDLLYRQAILAAADAADTGLIAADELRKDATAFKFWSPSDIVSFIKDQFIASSRDELQGEPGPPGGPGPRGLQGLQGIKGDKGDNAAAPNIAIGAVTTLDPGTNATASLGGTYPNYILNLGLPKGNTGTIDITGSGGGIWGAIGGTLTDQSDLVTALASKADASALTAFASNTYVDNGLAAKADASELTNYALLSDLSIGLAGKADHDDLAPYALSADVATGLAGKAPTVHSHAIDDVAGLQVALDGKQPSGNYLAPGNVAIADVIGLQTKLNSLQNQVTSGTTAPSGGSSGDVYFKL